MTNFLPYAIIAGIAIVFFVICYIMYSSGEKSESSPQPEKQNGKTKTRTRYDGEPQPRKVQHRRPATVKHARQLPNLAVEEDTEPLPKVPKMNLGERREHPEETAFVTTKGEAVRHNGRIVYREASVPVRRGPNADSVDATQVLSRDEILEAMEKVDKEEAAAYKAREEEAKLARQRQDEKEREEQERQLTENRERRERLVMPSLRPRLKPIAVTAGASGRKICPIPKKKSRHWPIWPLSFLPIWPKRPAPLPAVPRLSLRLNRWPMSRLHRHGRKKKRRLRIQQFRKRIVFLKKRRSSVRLM